MFIILALHDLFQYRLPDNLVQILTSDIQAACQATKPSSLVSRGFLDNSVGEFRMVSGRCR